MPHHDSQAGTYTVIDKDVDFGEQDDNAFFVIRLKDQFAAPALIAYAREAMQWDREYASEVVELAMRSMRMKNTLPS